MKNLVIALIAGLATFAVIADGHFLDGTWQKQQTTCALETVEKIDKKMPVKGCRIRFQIEGIKCNYATVTYGTMIGKVFKKGQCFLDPDTKQLEIIVTDKDGQEHEEFNGFLESVEDGFYGTKLEASTTDENKVYFYQKP